MVSYDHTIPPGEVGRITLIVNTKGYEGRIQKSARVNSNDPSMKSFSLTIMALVQVPIHVIPKYLFIKGKLGDSVHKHIDIVSSQDRPLRVVIQQFDMNDKLDCRIEEIEKGKRFRIYLTGRLSFVGEFHGLMVLRTNYPEKPLIKIWINGKTYTTPPHIN